MFTPFRVMKGASLTALPLTCAALPTQLPGLFCCASHSAPQISMTKPPIISKRLKSAMVVNVPWGAVPSAMLSGRLMATHQCVISPAFPR